MDHLSNIEEDLIRVKPNVLTSGETIEVQFNLTINLIILMCFFKMEKLSIREKYL